MDNPHERRCDCAGRAVPVTGRTISVDGGSRRE
jgi:hypothetical protein